MQAFYDLTQQHVCYRSSPDPFKKGTLKHSGPPAQIPEPHPALNHTLTLKLYTQHAPH